ncbi:MAG: ABC transporter permease [Lachnospiraceae bacterium]
MRKNPLHKRLLREMKTELGKYIVIFILLVTTIGFVSGFLVADNSMLLAYNEGFQKYNIEDGHFVTEKKMNRAQLKSVAASGNTLYEMFYAEESLDNGSTMRIYKKRDKVNGVCLMAGELPVQPDEIAIDRMYADNNGLKVGDTIYNGIKSWKITGLVALSDYSCLFSDNNDTMFDSLKFGVGIVTEENFSSYTKGDLTWCYAWKYPEKPADDVQEKEWADDFRDLLVKEVTLEEYVPCYLNQAIQFTGDDMGSDKAMMIVLLYIVIVIMAFVFSVTISNTITREAAVIGTLRASGYTKRELVLHYATMPVLVTLIGAGIGNILGYTVMKDVCADMYYGSYSLPTFVTVWNADAFVKTTVIPVILMFLINVLTLTGKLKLSPLKFLRRDLSRKKQKRALHLSHCLPFFMRFRLRVIFQNMSNYMVLLVGILFANFLLIFGMAFPSALKHYQDTIDDSMLCKYQYMLSVPENALNDDRKLESMFHMLQYTTGVETENEDAEKFSAYSLQTEPENSMMNSEEVLLYGIEPDSRYVSPDVSGSQVYMSSALQQKYDLHIGDTITMKEKYEPDEYTFTIAGVYEYSSTLALFMSREYLNKTFDFGSTYFGGYFSDSEITDIDEKYIGSVIDVDAMTKISRQLLKSMGGMMYLVEGFAILIFVVLVYLLSKIIIEKNSQSISMTKILGYNNGEISRLYILSTTIMVVLFILISLPIEGGLIRTVFVFCIKIMMNGWIELYMDPMIYLKMFVLGIVTYAVVAALEYRRIRKVPMTDALKNVE